MAYGKHHRGPGIHAHLHDGGVHIVGNVPFGILKLLFQVVIGLIHIGSVIVLQHYHGTSVTRCGTHGFHAFQRADGIFNRLRHKLAYIFRACAGIAGPDNQHRRLHIRHLLQLCGENGCDTKHNQAKKRHYCGDRMLKDVFCNSCPH